MKAVPPGETVLPSTDVPPDGVLDDDGAIVVPLTLVLDAVVVSVVELPVVVELVVVPGVVEVVDPPGVVVLVVSVSVVWVCVVDDVVVVHAEVGE